MHDQYEGFRRALFLPRENDRNIGAAPSQELIFDKYEKSVVREICRKGGKSDSNSRKVRGRKTALYAQDPSNLSHNAGLYGVGVNR